MADVNDIVVCAGCGYPHPARYSYHRTIGWERPRSEGGTHALRGRRPDFSVWLCHGCMEEYLCKVETRREAEIDPALMAALPKEDLSRVGKNGPADL